MIPLPDNSKKEAAVFLMHSQRCGGFLMQNPRSAV